MDLLNRVQKLIEENRLLCRGDGVIVGCSGGPDSLCLLHLLLRLREPMELRLRVVHLEHGFRGQASEQDARFVESFCAEHEIDCRIYREDVKETARETGISWETAGREARYRRFFREREQLEWQMAAEEPQKKPCVRIAVAHNRNDQAETVLMHILRGTGLEGLKGMELHRADGVIRPLLTTDRGEIEAYCADMGLTPRYDHTNRETDCTRNRIRLELLPYIREHFNENVEEALCRLGRIAAESQQVIRAEAERIARTCAGDRRQLARLSDGLRHAAVRFLLKEKGLSADVSSVHLYQIDRLLSGPAASGQVVLPRGYRVAVSYDTVRWLGPEETGADVAAERDSEERDWKEWELSRHLTVRDTDWTEVGSPERLRSWPLCQACLDGDKIRTVEEERGEKLCLRFRKPGDFIRPLGSRGRKKMQDWMVDRKIPRQERDGLPLLCIGSEVVWIPGYGISENFKLENKSMHLIFVEFHQ
ncbi:MAG: tRNA lysidine(34) synthetase TilS [Firmicutes bacterium]|nr:tRNA lysidine(34) synthetase TilS [Bacillota bacterium]